MKILMTLTAGMVALAAAGGVMATPAPTESERAQLKALCSMIDRNGDGRITRREMDAFGAGKGYGRSINPKIWKAMDANGDGAVTFAEYERHSMEWTARKRMIASR